MRREVLPARLSVNVAMAISISMMLAGCALFVHTVAASDNTIEPPSLSPVHEPIPLLWPQYFHSLQSSWFRPAVMCAGHTAMMWQFPGWECDLLQ